MKNANYIIIGQGLAGSILAWKFILAGRKVLVVDSAQNQTASRVAAGLFNPLVFRWLTKSWLADELLPEMHALYREMEEFFQEQFVFPYPILKLLNEEKKARWEKKRSKGKLSPFLGELIETPPFPGLQNYPAFGYVNHGGYVRTDKLLSSIRNWLKSNNAFTEEEFKFDDLSIRDDSVRWKNIDAGQIVFCEGAMAFQNPLFPYVKYNLTGGDLLEVEIENFQEEYILNKHLYLLPRGDNRYLCGSTYIHGRSNYQPTSEGQATIEEGLRKILKAPYKIIEHRTAVRPTVKDRRPVLGKHPEYDQVSYFNGLGTKGVMLAPRFAREMYDLLEKDIAPLPEVRLNRFL